MKNLIKERISSYREEADQLVKKLSIKEKVYLMSGKVTSMQMGYDFVIKKHYNRTPYPTGDNKRLGIPAMKFCDGPRGMVSGNGTCFPVSMGRGATFDVELEKKVGDVIGKEIRAMGGNFFGGVCINIPRNPGWGRSQEVYGEESFHLGQMGVALTEGVQSHNVMACIKHYAFNSMENARFKVNVKCSKRTEREVYLSHFKDCIDAGAASVMTAYNKYLGVHCGHSEYLIRDVLKDEWDFHGFVISDFVWGIRDTAPAANSGMDVEMCNTKYFGKKLVKAVKDGKVKESVIDEAVVRIVSTILAFTQADDTQQYPEEIIACDEHIELAKTAAEKSMTLIKNDNVLPLKKDIKKLAVIGRLAQESNLGDHGSSRVHPPYTVTPLDGLKKLLPDCEIVYANGSDMQEAEKAAKDAEAVIVFAGYDREDEGEYVSEKMDLGGDRKESLGLKKEEIKLINSVGSKNKNIAVVLIGGNMIMLNDWHDNVASILMAYYPGMEGGNAIAATLFGDNNPGGKLPFVIPFEESDLPKTDWNADEIEYEYYHGYAKLDKENIKPMYHYGHGLSYTEFKLSNADISIKSDELIAKCKIKNTGQIEGDEVVQLYVGFENSKIDRPLKLLRGFKRVSLDKGEEKVVTIICPLDKLKWFNPEKKCWEMENIKYSAYLGTDSNVMNSIKSTFTL